MKRAAQYGFTLAEVLVALLIFSLIAAASVYALNLGVNARDQLGDADEALKELQLARMLIKEDTAQIVMRPVRDEFGATAPAPFQGGRNIVRSRIEDDEQILVSFTRAGWLNPQASAPRSALQYVEYLKRGNAVIRRSRPYLDDARGASRVERVLFSNVETAAAEFVVGEFRGELEWTNEWPVSGSGPAAPIAMALIVGSANGEEIRHLFWIGSLGGVGV